jgi:hypothetical protein
VDGSDLSSSRNNCRHFAYTRNASARFPAAAWACISDRQAVSSKGSAASSKDRDDDDAVKKAQAHAKVTHGMDLSWEQALSMAKPA